MTLHNLVPFPKCIGKLACIVLVAGCATKVPGPSIPLQSGSNLSDARRAFKSCISQAEKSGQSTLTGHYVGSVLWGGVVLGPIIVASNSPAIRYNAEVSGMDRCLEKRGFARRDLTQQEVRFLNQADQLSRRTILNHLIGGGSLDNLPLEYGVKTP